jgi:hypothetical protein
MITENLLSKKSERIDKPLDLGGSKRLPVLLKDLQFKVMWRGH